MAIENEEALPRYRGYRLSALAFSNKGRRSREWKCQGQFPALNGGAATRPEAEIAYLNMFIKQRNCEALRELQWDRSICDQQINVGYQIVDEALAKPAGATCQYGGDKIRHA